MHHLPPADEDKHVYMVVYDLPATTTHLDQGSTLGSWGVNTVNRTPAYTPPCSKGPGVKEYILTVYALSAPPDFSKLSVSVRMDDLLSAVQKHHPGESEPDAGVQQTVMKRRRGSASRISGKPRPTRELFMKARIISPHRRTLAGTDHNRLLGSQHGGAGQHKRDRLHQGRGLGRQLVCHLQRRPP